MGNLPVTVPASGQTSGETHDVVEPNDPTIIALGDVIDQPHSARGLNSFSTALLSNSVREKDYKIRTLERKLKQLGEKYDKCFKDQHDVELKLAALTERQSSENSTGKLLSILKVVMTVAGGIVIAIGSDLYKIEASYRSGLTLISLGLLIVLVGEIGVLLRGFKR